MSLSQTGHVIYFLDAGAWLPSPTPSVSDDSPAPPLPLSAGSIASAPRLILNAAPATHRDDDDEGDEEDCNDDDNDENDNEDNDNVIGIIRRPPSCYTLQTHPPTSTLRRSS